MKSQAPGLGDVPWQVTWTSCALQGGLNSHLKLDNWEPRPSGLSTVTLGLLSQTNLFAILVGMVAMCTEVSPHLSLYCYPQRKHPSKLLPGETTRVIGFVWSALFTMTLLLLLNSSRTFSTVFQTTACTVPRR